MSPLSKNFFSASHRVLSLQSEERSSEGQQVVQRARLVGANLLVVKLGVARVDERRVLLTRLVVVTREEAREVVTLVDELEVLVVWPLGHLGRSKW